MVVGVLTVQIHLHGIGSLKDKRSIVKSVIGRLQSRFNASVSEVAALDSKLQGIVGVAVVSNEGPFVQQQLDTIISFIRGDGRFYVGRIERDVFDVDHDLADY